MWLDVLEIYELDCAEIRSFHVFNPFIKYVEFAVLEVVYEAHFKASW